MDETANSIDRYVQKLQDLQLRWPGFDLGPIEQVLHGGDVPSAPTSPSPPTPQPPDPPPVPGNFSYQVVARTFALLGSFHLTVEFFTNEKEIGYFSGIAAGFAAGIGFTEGTASFDVESLARQHWAGKFVADSVPGTLRIRFLDSSDKIIASVNTKGLQGGFAIDVHGQGDFRLGKPAASGGPGPLPANRNRRI
jgi:hypothetical protein